MTPVELLLSKLPDAKKTGKGWSARCPAHDDQNPSLAISEGDDGRALVNCHAGCKLEAICAAVGIKSTELFPPSTSTVLGSKREKTAKRGQCNQKSAPPTYATASLAVAILERRYGKRSALWTYLDADEKPVGVD